MPAFTTHLNLYLPGGGSLGIGGDDEEADVDKINQNMQKIDDWADDTDDRLGILDQQLTRNQQFTGTAANIGSVVGMKLGDTYQETDGKKILWKYDGANWITAENGMYLVRPTGVFGTGVTIADNGHVKVAAGGDTVRINGCFSARFSRYLVIANWRNTPGASGAYMRFCTGGAPLLNTQYVVQNSAVVGTTFSGSSAINTNTPGAIGNSSIRHAVRYEFYNPMDAAEFTLVRGDAADYDGVNGLSQVMIWNTAAGAHDGFELVVSVGGQTISSAEFSIYGLA